jgi:endonuclease G, mitochondrial
MVNELTIDEKARRIRNMLAKIAGDEGIESVVSRGGSSLKESVGEHDLDTHDVLESVQRLETGRNLNVSDMERLEAIVLPNERPVAYIRRHKYSTIPQTRWRHLNEQDVHDRIEPLFPSIGRIELPGCSIANYFGTAFVVGPNLLMTNRHVARIFCDGVGTKSLRYEPDSAALDFIREDGVSKSAVVRVLNVVMVHPYWDMALLKVETLPIGVEPLKLAVKDPEEYLDQDVIIVGYPARDPRSNLEIQDRIFERKYGVKRLQPGKARAREQFPSFGNKVGAMTHDASTLGGNSGSAVIDVKSGVVIGLHFAGEYLKANYAVPTIALARDSRVVDGNVNFVSRIAADDSLTKGAWTAADRSEAPPNLPDPQPKGSSPQPSVRTTVSVPAPVLIQGGVTLTIPLQVTVSLGSPIAGTQVATVANDRDYASVEKVPVVFPDLASRTGYRADFLGLDDNVSVPMPVLTDKGKIAATKLLAGGKVLHYHKFSIVMHRQRRLAIFTAANVDWRQEKREVGGRKTTRKELNGFEGSTSETWVLDPRIAADAQLPDVFYTKDDGAWDKGHLVRRDDVAYGDDFEDMQMSNGDSFHVTNCSPQTAKFNRPKPSEYNWGALEEMIRKQTSTEKVCIFSGPVFTAEDRFFHCQKLKGQDVSVAIPSRFWKIIVANHAGAPAAFGFILGQDLIDVPLHEELVVPEAWKRFMRPISKIEKLLGGLLKLSFLKDCDEYEG